MELLLLSVHILGIGLSQRTFQPATWASWSFCKRLKIILFDRGIIFSFEVKIWNCNYNDLPFTRISFVWAPVSELVSQLGLCFTDLLQSLRRLFTQNWRQPSTKIPNLIPLLHYTLLITPILNTTPPTVTVWLSDLLEPSILTLNRFWP